MLGEHHKRSTGLANTVGFCCLKRISADYELRHSQVRIPLSAWIVFSCVCYVYYMYRLIRCADYLFRGFLPSVCVYVWPIKLKCRRARPELGRWVTNTEQLMGLSPHIMCHTRSVTVHIHLVNKRNPIQHR
jgi:hypothetical protein